MTCSPSISSGCTGVHLRARCDEALAYAGRLESAGLRITREVFSKAAQWPDALLQAGHAECRCAAGAQEQFWAVFEVTRKGMPAGS